MFTGAQADARDLTMVEAHVLRAQKLATMSEPAFLSSFGEVFRAATHVAAPVDEAARRIYALHKRYGEAVVKVVDRQLVEHASLDSILELPETSLLAMIRSPVTRYAPHVDPAEQDLAKDAVKPSLDPPAGPRPVIFAIQDRPNEVMFVDGPLLRNKSCELFLRLAAQFRRDLESEIERVDFNFVPSRSIANDLGMTLENLRQLVNRTRRDLEKQFEATIGYTLDQEDIIQSRSWQGYRLNPFLIQIDIRQAASSRLSPAGVTTRRPTSTDRGGLAR
jgi:hypothetical protein